MYTKYLLNVEPLASTVHFTVLPFRNWKTPMCTIIGKFSLNTLGGGTLRQAFSIRRFGRRSSHPLDSNIRLIQESNYHRSSKNSAWQGQGVPFFSKTNSGGLPTFFAVFCQQMLRVKELFNTTQQYFMNFFANQEKNSIKKDSK